MDNFSILNLFSSTTDKKYIGNNEIYHIRLIWKNISELNLYNITIKDIVPKNAKITNYPIKINGIDDLENYILLGINVSKLNAHESLDIIIPLKSNLSDGGNIDHSFKIQYEYYDYAKDSYVQQEEIFNLPQVIVKTTNINLDTVIFKTSCKNPSIGDNFSLNLSLKNTGNISANNTVVSIKLPDEIQRCEDSIIVNQEKFNIPKGIREINIGKINFNSEINVEIPLTAIKNTNLNAAKLQGIIKFDTMVIPTISYKTTLNLPDIFMEISSPSFNIKSNISNTFPIVGDSIEVSYILKNEGNRKSIDTKLFLDIPENLKLEKDFIMINNNKIKKEDLLVGLSLGDIDVNIEKKITLNFICNEPLLKEISSITGKLVYKYTNDDHDNLRYSEMILKNVEIKIHDANCSLALNHDKKVVLLDDIITFTILIKNTGDLEALNIFIKGVIPCELSEIKESMIINNNKFSLGNIVKGVCVGNLKPDECTEVKFSCKVNLINYTRTMILSIEGNFQYRSQNYSIKDKVLPPAEIIQYSEEALFKSISLEPSIKLPPNYPDLIEVLEVNSLINITDHYIVQSPKVNGTNINKLIVNGFVESTFEYISNTFNENIYLVESKTNFSTFIALPSSYTRENKVLVESSVLDEKIKIINKRNIYSLITFNIDGRIIR